MTQAHHNPQKNLQPLLKPRDPGCVCHQPLYISLRPGEHFHPCKVHPERAVYGSGPVYS